jgi:signal transduction histidine kinase
MMRLVIAAAACIGLILFVAFVASRLLRSRRRGLSIRLQVFLALAAIVGAFAFGLGLLVIDRIEARASRVALESATGESQLAARLIANDIELQQFTLLQVASQLETLAKRQAPLRLELRDERGMLLFPEQPQALPADQQWVWVDTPITIEGRTLGSVRALKETVHIQRLLADFAPTVLVISLVLGAAAALAAAWIGRAIAAPIEELTSYGERVSQGLTDAAPLPFASGREVSRLARAIDSMRRQLQGRPFVETFAADLSHELKNPVAAIRASAETLHDGALDEPERARHFVNRILEATVRIEVLLSELLSLAKIEAHGVTELERVNLTELTRRAIATSAEPNRITLHERSNPTVHADAGWLTRALRNLIDNALIHGQPATRVEVSIDHVGTQAIVQVSNSGHVARHAKNNIFRRFITTRPHGGGTGLGLPIVRAILEAHGGSAELIAAGPPLVEFRLTLPAPPTP